MNRTVNPKLLLIAMLFLAALCFVAGVSGLQERLLLLEQGLATTGVVTGIDVGVKGLRSAEASFTTREGHTSVGQDIHKTQWFAANEIGDRVSLYYAPQQPQAILIDRGLAIWSNPAFFLAGGVFLCGLAIFIYRQPVANSTSQ